MTRDDIYTDMMAGKRSLGDTIMDKRHIVALPKQNTRTFADGNEIAREGEEERDQELLRKDRYQHDHLLYNDLRNRAMYKE